MERRAPAAGEVEIAVRATALNFRDVLNTLGLYPGDPGPLGGECAGTVVAVGPGVAELRPGDEVIALAGGSFASHVVADTRFVVPKPARWTPEEAATIPIAYVTAAFALRHLAGIREGDRVLVHAAAGGVGLAAVHLARLAGAEVFATAGTGGKRALLRSMGVAHVMSSRTPEFAAEILRLTDGRGVDVVLNSLAGDLIAASFECLAIGGRFLELGKNGIWSEDAVAALGKRIAYHVIDWSVDARQNPAFIGSMLRSLVAEAEAGRLPLLPMRTFSIDHAREAFRFMAQGRHVGKLIVQQPRSLADAAIVRGDGTYLVTGGLTGLGLLTAQWLAARGARHLVLAGRRAPSEAARLAVAAIEQHGASVTVAAVDVADRAALGALLDGVRRELPPIRGIVHAAGALSDGALLQQTWDKFDAVFRPKVAGTALLDELTRPDALDFFVIYSSIAGVFGSPGQGNHAAASAYEDAVAASRRAAGLPATSIGWGAWSEIGAAVTHRAIDRADRRGMEAITPTLGLEALDRALCSGRAHVVVAPIDWTRFSLPAAAARAPFFSGCVTAAMRPVATSSAEPSAEFLPSLVAAPPARRRKLLLDHLRAQAVKVLGLDAAEPLDEREALHERGLDSLMAVELRNVLGRSLGCTLPATLLFDYPTLDALAVHLGSVIAVPEIDEQPVAVRREPGAGGAGVVESVEDLSDEEVDRLFAARLEQKD
jgi:NADPH:quinone reductase-like Zn-dependent oxidoreductase/acyl carrier protein